MHKPHSDSPLSLLEWAAIAFVVIVWGLNNIAAKVATDALPPIFVGGLRFGLALPFLLPFIKPPFPSLGRITAIILLIGPLNYGLLYIGFANLHSLSAFIVSLQLWVPLTALVAWWLMGEAMGPTQILGLTIAFVGIAWMTLSPGVKGDTLAIMLGLGASMAWALGTVLVRKGTPIRPLKLQGLTAIITAPILLGAAFLTEPGIGAAVKSASLAVWASVIWAAISSTIIATAVMFWLVQRREPGRVTPYFLLTPLVSALISVVFMGEHITAQVAIGSAATLTGVALVALSERRTAKRSAAAAT